jgi:L-iditol 2-dehydrogenase
MKQAYYPGIGKLPEIREVAVPEIKDDEVLIQMKAGAVCNMTEIHTVLGYHPPHNLWCTGHFTNPPDAFPSPAGHEGAGVIAKAGKLIKKFREGDRVQTLAESAAFSEYGKTVEGELARIPDSLTYEEAAVSQIFGELYGIVEESVYSGDVVVILGQGGTGMPATQLAKLRGASKVIVSDPDPMKRDLALKLGADVAIDPSREDLIDRVMQLTNGKGVDAVIECVGIPETIKLETRLIKVKDLSRPGERGATIAQWGACREHVPFDFMELHWKFGKIITAGSTMLAYSSIAMERVMNMVSIGKIQVKPLITHRFALQDVGKAFQMLMEGKESRIKVVIQIAKD